MYMSYMFCELSDDVSYFFQIEVEISPFLQEYRRKTCYHNSLDKISTGPTCMQKCTILALKAGNKTKMELSLKMVAIQMGLQMPDQSVLESGLESDQIFVNLNFSNPISS